MCQLNVEAKIFERNLRRVKFTNILTIEKGVHKFFSELMKRL